MTRQRNATSARMTANAAFLAGARQGDFMAVRRALHAGVSPRARDHEGSALAAMQKSRGRRKMMELLVDAGLQPDLTNPAGQTPLMQAVVLGDQAYVNALLAVGADPNFLNEQRETALSFAAVWGRTAIAALLLRQGANPDRPLKPWTPLMYAAREGNVRLARLLLGAGARANRKDPHGQTAWDIARNAHRAAFVRMPEAIHAIDRR